MVQMPRGVWELNGGTSSDKSRNESYWGVSAWELDGGIGASGTGTSGSGKERLWYRHQGWGMGAWWWYKRRQE